MLSSRLISSLFEPEMSIKKKTVLEMILTLLNYFQGSLLFCDSSSSSSTESGWDSCLIYLQTLHHLVCFWLPSPLKVQSGSSFSAVLARHGSVCADDESWTSGSNIKQSVTFPYFYLTAEMEIFVLNNSFFLQMKASFFQPSASFFHFILVVSVWDVQMSPEATRPFVRRSLETQRLLAWIDGRGPLVRT